MIANLSMHQDYFWRVLNSIYHICVIFLLLIFIINYCKCRTIEYGNFLKNIGKLIILSVHIYIIWITFSFCVDNLLLRFKLSVEIMQIVNIKTFFTFYFIFLVFFCKLCYFTFEKMRIIFSEMIQIILIQFP